MPVKAFRLFRVGAMTSMFWIIALLTACSPDKSEKSINMLHQIEISANQSGKELLARYSNQIVLINSPPNVNFYSVDWPRDALGAVEIRNGTHAFMLNDVLGISGNEDSHFPDENIIEWNIYAGLGAEEHIPHDEARQRMMRILNNIRAAGWRHYTERSLPRLKGAQALHFAITSPVHSLDPAYVPDLDEWMSLPADATWRFQLDHAYLTLTLTRDTERLDRNKPGAYFLKLSLVGSKEEARQIVGPAKRSDWQNALTAELPLLKQDRDQAEETLRRRGVVIDSAYQDPSIP